MRSWARRVLPHPNPTVGNDLGRYHITGPTFTTPATSQVTNGPNQGYNYVPQGIANPFVCSADINHAAFTAGSAFALAQGNSPGEPNVAAVEVSVRRHEGIIDQGQPSHHKYAQDYAAAHPMNPWAEPQVSHVSAESNAAFESRVVAHWTTAIAGTIGPQGAGKEPPAAAADLAYPDPILISGPRKVVQGGTATYTVTVTGGTPPVPAPNITWRGGAPAGTISTVNNQGVFTATGAAGTWGFIKAEDAKGEEATNTDYRIDIIAPP